LLIKVRLPLTHKALRRLEQIKESLRVNEDEHRVERLIDRDTYLKTKNKLETQRHEVDTKINAASGQRFLINLPRDREESKAAHENGNPSRANDRRRRADLLRPHLAMAAAHQRQEGAEVARSTQLW
jgi:hypothetical protein